MMRGAIPAGRLAGAVLLLLSAASTAKAEEVVTDFENAVPLLAEQKANRVPNWVENGVTFTLAWDPKQTKGKGMLMFFSHLSNRRKGIVNAMATEPIPVRATFAKPVSSVTIAVWGSSVTPAVLEAFDSEGKIVDRASLDALPPRKTPAEPAPVVTLSVKGSRIAYVHISGPRDGEYLVTDELRFTPVASE
jgi:hypothetical protein